MLLFDLSLSETDLDYLRSYKYHSGTYTPFDLLLSRFVNWTLPLVPHWIAPNVITLLGFIVHVIGVVCLVVLKNEDGSPMRVAYLLDMISKLFYMYMDTLDGKQARRLGCSSPLGQLFDHGCDSLSGFFVIFSTVYSIGIDNPRIVASLFGLVGCVFVSYQIIEYYQGILLSGVPYFGVSEVLFLSVLILLLTSIWGQEFWHTPLMVRSFSFTLSDCVLFFIFVVITGIVLFQNIRVLVQGSQLEEKERGGKTLTRLNHFMRFIPLL